MAFAQVQYLGDGANTLFGFSFPYIQKSHIEVRVANVLQTQNVAYTFPTGSTIQFTSPPAAGAAVDIRRRSSQAARLTDYQNGTLLTEAQMDADATQLFYLAQEAMDAVFTSLQLGLDATYDVTNHRIRNVGAPTETGDAATKGYADTLDAATRGYVDTRDAAVTADAHSYADTLATNTLKNLGDSTWYAQGLRIRNLGTPVSDTDAATKAYVDAAGGGGGGGEPVVGTVDLRDVWLFAL
jgi:hypothetical protein